MKNISIIYWSGTFNTKIMAEYILRGIEEKNSNVKLFEVREVDSSIADQSDVLVLGCPAMGDEVLEQSTFQPFMDSIADKIKGKDIALFGSYAWGDGEWMRDWEESIKELGGNLIDDGLIINYSPDDETECVAFGHKIADI